jgi:hypothetical protein
MCLSKLLPLPKRLPKYGYKVFGLIDGELLGFMPSLRYEGPFDYNETLHPARMLEVGLSDANGWYWTGFHVFRYKRAAKLMSRSSAWISVVRKVKMDKITSYGTQQVDNWSAESYVCQEMVILPDVKDRATGYGRKRSKTKKSQSKSKKRVTRVRK